MNQPAAPWALRTRSGLTVMVPPMVRRLSTYVLLEQEQWFEPEMSLLPLLLQPGMNTLDIGANHGVYALELARLTQRTSKSAGRDGHVFAFEPTTAPRACLLQSVQANGYSKRITVAAMALAERDGETQFSVHGDSEHNTRNGHSAQQETVRLCTLDAYLAEHAPDMQFGFIKLDAEGDEERVLAGGAAFFARQSPVILFELKHGTCVNLPLLQTFSQLGYETYRWCAELALLLPFDAASDETNFALNLVALRPASVLALSASGLLASRAELAVCRLPVVERNVLRQWSQRAAWQGAAFALDDEAFDAALKPQAALLNTALASVASAHAQSGLAPAERVLLIASARDQLLAALQGGAVLGAEVWALAVHCLMALGQQDAALTMAIELLAHWPLLDTAAAQPTRLPFMPPLQAQLDAPRSTACLSWLQHQLAEFVARNLAYSTYFVQPDPQRWAALWVHPDHSSAVERAGLLVHLACGQMPPLHLLRWLPDAAHTGHPAFWAALLESMRGSAAAAPQTPAATPAAGLAHNRGVVTSASTP